MEVKLEPGILIALDSAPIIYFIENHVEYAPRIRHLLDQCAALNIQMVTSMVSYIEVLTLPEKLGQHELAARYRAFLTNAKNFSLFPLNIQVADQCIRYRADFGFNTPDAIQLAVAKISGARYFITNDAALTKCQDVGVVLMSDLPIPEVGGRRSEVRSLPPPHPGSFRHR